MIKLFPVYLRAEAKIYNKLVNRLNFIPFNSRAINEERFIPEDDRQHSCVLRNLCSQTRGYVASACRPRACRVFFFYRLYKRGKCTSVYRPERVSVVAACLLPVNWVALLHSFDHSTSSFNSAIVVPATSFSSRFAGFSTPRARESADWFLSRADLVKFHRQSVLSIPPSSSPNSISLYTCII